MGRRSKGAVWGTKINADSVYGEELVRDDKAWDIAQRRVTEGKGLTVLSGVKLTSCELPLRRLCPESRVVAFSVQSRLPGLVFGIEC